MGRLVVRFMDLGRLEEGFACVDALRKRGKKGTSSNS
jgi:hypothetical protein